MLPPPDHGTRCALPALVRRTRSLVAAVVLVAIGIATRPPGAAADEVAVGALVLDAPPGHARALEDLAERARVMLPAVEAHLGVSANAPWRMWLIPPGPIADPALGRLDAAAPRWAAGFVLPERRIGAIRVAEAARYPYGTLESVLAHEATHLLLHDAVGRRLPRWFDEGVATWEGRRWSLEDAWLYSSSLLRDDVPPLADLEGSFTGSASRAREAYAASFSFVSWALDAYGQDLVRDLLRESRRRPFDRAWRDLTGASLLESERAWRRENLSRVRWIAFLVASNVLWIGITLLALIAGIVRRARARRARELLPDGPDFAWDEVPPAEPGSRPPSTGSAVPGDPPGSAG